MKNTRTIRADIPIDVWERFSAEAAAKGVPMGRHLRNLLVARDSRIVSRNTGENAAADAADREAQP